MLHAITGKKSKFYRRYLGHRESGERRVCEEDELTAMLLGPLALMPPQIMGVFWKELLLSRHVSDLPDGFPVSGEMHFWPKRSNIEPDLFVTLTWRDGEKRVLLVEMKWGSGLSEKQLHKQWQIFLSPEEQEKAFHLFIGKNTIEAIKAEQEEDVWNGRLQAFSWDAVLSVLSTMQRENRQQHKDLQTWIEQILGVLPKLGLRPFFGFDRITLSDACLEVSSNNTVFWTGFTGFIWMPCIIIPAYESTLFFNA
ncbi:hypothetical protein [Desulfobotulus mexicanus]|uniref:Uncharacterized protein n=1 Tax=Desulfobotulus mexicanus TaxID=2586642 RepID=A0A5S5MEQ3_9BACT|nr:hypothetical protein [Desulfobotulus mexicanus]TYT74192.1 hypothetical protein FIM25_11450 [Desulfobotulus mexicanus]